MITCLCYYLCASFIWCCFNERISPRDHQTFPFCKDNIFFFFCFSTSPTFPFFPTTLLVSCWSRSSCRSSGLSWPLCKICSNASRNHSGVRKMSGYSWKPEPKLCSTRLWNRKWLLKGGSRFVVRVCWGQSESMHKQRGKFLWKNLSFELGVCADTWNARNVMVVPACRSGPAGRTIVVDWAGCWMMLKPSSAVGSQRQVTRSWQSTDWMPAR